MFDLAGITCGHFLVPFWTFFGATLIGKAVIKMHIQVRIHGNGNIEMTKVIWHFKIVGNTCLEIIGLWKWHWQYNDVEMKEASSSSWMVILYMLKIQPRERIILKISNIFCKFLKF